MASKDDPKSKNINSARSPRTTKKPKSIEAKAPVEPENRDCGLRIVGISASTGGLEETISPRSQAERDQWIGELQADNQRLREQLQVTVEEYKSSNEEANQKLRQARDLFYALFSANPIPTILTRIEDGIFLNVNAEFLNYFDLQPEDVIGHSAEEFDLGLGLGITAYEKFVNQIKEDGKVRSYETRVRRPSGEERNILASVQLVELDEKEAMITTFIDITDRVRAEQQVRSLVSELTASEQAERHRIAQILHDDLQQRIFAIQMQLSFLQEAYERDDLQSFALDFSQVNEWLTEAIKVTRQLSVDLSPPILHGEGLIEATIWLASQMEEQYGLKTKIQSNGTPMEIEEKVRVLVFYAIRELLFNVVKHAGTLEAGVRFEHEASRLRVVVRDQGSGFDSTQVMSNPIIAHGLLIMRHRLNLLGCSMEVHSQPGKGAEAIIEVPYQKLDTQL